MAMKTTRPQLDVSKRWNKENKARKNYLAKRSMALISNPINFQHKHYDTSQGCTKKTP